MRINYTENADQQTRYNRLVGDGVPVDGGSESSSYSSESDGSDFVDLADLQPGFFAERDINQEALALLWNQLGNLQAAVHNLGELIIDSGGEAATRTSEVLTRIGLLQGRLDTADRAATRLRPWYRAPAVVVGTVVVTTVFVYKLIENIVSLAAGFVSGTSTQPDILSQRQIEALPGFEPDKEDTLEKVSQTAAKVTTAPETNQDHIDARAERKRRKRNDL